MKFETNILSDPQELQRQLAFHDLLPVSLIVGEQQSVGSDSAWDKFMHDLYGHPEHQDFKDVRDPRLPEDSRTYPYRKYEGFSSEMATVFLMRATNDKPIEPEDYLPITLDLYESRITVWTVDEIRIAHDGAKEFMLAEFLEPGDKSGNLFAVPELVEPMRVIAMGLRLARSRAQSQSKQAKIVWGEKRREFQNSDGQVGLFTHRVLDLVKTIDAYNDAQLDDIQTESASKPATIVAA